MNVISKNGEAITIELVTEADIWSGIYDGRFQFGEEIPAKIVVQHHQSILFVYIPKMIKKGKTDVEHMRKERKTIDYMDFLALNKAIAVINAPLYEILPR